MFRGGVLLGRANKMDLVSLTKKLIKNDKKIDTP